MKNLIKSIIVLGIIWLVFSICYFVIPYHHNNSMTFGLVYVFSAIAFLVQIYPIAVTFIKSKKLKSKVYTLPLIGVGIIYLVLQLLLSIAMCILNSMMPVSTWIPTLISIVLLAFVVIGFIGAETYKDEVEKIEQNVEINTVFLDDLKRNSKSLYSYFSYEPLKNKFKKLHEIILYSDPVSSPELALVEDEITKKFTKLQELYLKSDYDNLEYSIDELISLMIDRNNLCKSKKINK